MKTLYYTATSLDGFIADPQHSLDWLLQFGMTDDYPTSSGTLARSRWALPRMRSLSSDMRSRGSYEAPVPGSRSPRALRSTLGITHRS